MYVCTVVMALSPMVRTYHQCATHSTAGDGLWYSSDSAELCAGHRARRAEDGGAVPSARTSSIHRGAQEGL